MKKKGFFTKTILLVVFLVALSVVPIHAQRDPFMGGARMYLEMERVRIERDRQRQEMELINQQIESMKATRKEFTNEWFQRGFQEGYQKGLEYMSKNPSMEAQIILFNFVGRDLFNITSIENLVEARKIYVLGLNTVNHYLAKIYITLIDARLEELRQMEELRQRQK